MDNNLHIFGIRHHGPGSARSVRAALEKLQPDVILVEGPPEAEAVLPLLAHAQMQPPVALLLYMPDQPDQAVYYPFAVFSPEWQAMEYGLKQNIPVRFMDLPQSHQLGQPEAEGENAPAVRTDPLGALAEAAGYSDGERWWEHLVEQRRDSADLFVAILEAMTAVRSELPEPPNLREERREAFMRQTIRAAQKEGKERIAVVCGAWHGPALAQMLPSAKDDAAILKDLPKAKVSATWVPWTYGRLSYFGGYGAGIESPGWYHHLWEHPHDVSVHWMSRVAHLLREQDLDASPASVIEGVRLAETLAALRGRPLPGLPELNEATQSVFCFGSDLPMRLILEKLIVSETLGTVPDETPSVPLQQDLAREQKRLRLPPEATQKELDFDLRKPNDRDKSGLLHRLNLLGVPWGEAGRGSGGKGTFHELWRVQWQPEFSVKIIEAAIWGTTVETAASASAKDKADKAAHLPALTTLLDAVLLADLPEAVRHVMARLEAEAALASDTQHLMAALPPLANVLRYGNVRQTDTSAVGHIVQGLVTRICIGLPSACASLNDEAAGVMDTHVTAVHAAIGLLQNEEHQALWQQTLGKLAERESLHGLIAGRCVRLLLDAGALTADAAARRMGLALSTASDPPQAAAWVEGFLKGSGLLLLHDQTLWAVLDEWVTTLHGDAFTALVPLLRRTFSTFAAPERRQMGERVKQGPVVPSAQGESEGRFDGERADAVLPLLARLLGLEGVTV